MANTAVLVGLLYSDVSSQQTYEQSLYAKQRSRCAGEFMIKTGGAYKISGIASRAVRVTRDTELNRSLSDQQKIDRLMAIREDIRKDLGPEYAKYTDCVANYSLVNTIGSSLYAKTGRAQPPLAGTYEEQVRTLVREFRWELNYYAGLTAAAERKKVANASRKIRYVSTVINFISDLPDPISADIDINSQGLRGTIRPIFMGYGDNDVITLRSDATPPANSRLQLTEGDYKLYSNGPGFILTGPGFIKYYSSFSREGLLKYTEFLKADLRGRKVSNRSSPWAFAEFSKFLNRFGNNFDGTVKFKSGRSRRPYGDGYIDFQFYGFKGHNNVGPKDIGVAVYFDDRAPGWNVDNDHVNDFRNSFREFAVGGSRREIHMFSNIRGHSGTHPAGVTEIPAPITANLFLILEEK